MDLAANWIHKLHNLSIAKDFAFPQFAVANMIPSPDKFLPDFVARNAQQGQQATELINRIQAWEAKFNQNQKLGLIYGDYHPENIIIDGLQADKLKMIDFTDVALGDPMIDLGTFLQQLYFMSQEFISAEKINTHKEYFVKSYFKKNLAELETHFFQRINSYCTF